MKHQLQDKNRTLENQVHISCVLVNYRIQYEKFEVFNHYLIQNVLFLSAICSVYGFLKILSVNKFNKLVKIFVQIFVMTFDVELSSQECCDQFTPSFDDKA